MWSEFAKSVGWNAMLAIVPVGCAYGVRELVGERPVGVVRGGAALVLGAMWLAFVPNTCYLLTEWRHFLYLLDAGNLFLRAETDSVLFVKLLLASMFYFAYALFGMMTFTLAIRPLERLAIKRGVAAKFWIVCLLVAISAGVYLGLVLRLNSWDVVMHPAWVWAGIVEIGGHPLLVAVILAFAVFLWVCYECLDIWIDGLKQRLLNGKSAA